MRCWALQSRLYSQAHFVNLRPKYIQALHDTVKENFDVIRKFVDDHYRVPPNLRRTNAEVSGKSVSQTISQLHNISKEDYYNVKRQRSLVPRSPPASTSQYNRFLCQVYPIGSKFDIDSAHNAYSSLPYPAPLYLEDQHLEDWIGIVYKTSENANSHLISVLSDLAASNMPVSESELSSAVRVLIETTGDGEIFKHDDTSFEDIKMYLKRSVPYISDTTVCSKPILTVLLQLALKKRKHGIFQTVLQEIKAQKIEPDRWILHCIMLHEGYRKNLAAVKEAYQKIISSGYVVNSSSLNTFVKCLILCKEFGAVEKLTESLVALNQVNRPRSSITKSLEYDLISVMDFVAEIVLSNGSTLHWNVPIVLDETTFKMLLRLYCIELQNFPKTIRVLQQMDNAGYTPELKNYLMVLEVFASGLWNLEELNSFCEYLLPIMRSHWPESGSVVHKARRAYERLCTQFGGQGELRKIVDQAQSHVDTLEAFVDFGKTHIADVREKHRLLAERL